MKVTSFITLSLLLMFALGVSIHACFSDENYYVFLQFWYFNSANVHQSYLGIDLLATQDNAANMSMVGEFDLYGTNQYVRLWIDCYPMSNETQWTGLTIQVKGTFLDINGTREYSNIYNNTIVVMPESIQGINRIEYFFNFSNEIQKVKEQVYPEQSLENIGIYGSLALDVTIHGIVGQVGTQNYIKLALHADSGSPYGWVLLPSIRIPETAQWHVAKIDAVDMAETFPDLRQTTLTVTQGIGNDHQIYAVWQTSAPISWQDQMTTFPISLVWGLLIGLSSSIIYDKRQGIYDKLHGRKRSVTENDTTHNEPKPQQTESDERDKSNVSEKSGGVRECELVLAEIKQESKAARLFWVFKPSECIHGEPFDLQLSFRNKTIYRFEGGECQFQIRGELSYPFSVVLPVIEPNEVKTVTVPDIVLGEVGLVALSNIGIKSRDGKLVPIRDKNSSGLLDPHYAFPLSFASKEEIYQKYAVIVALASSALASVLTVVNVIVALLK